MDESALNPVVQEALSVSRKISRFLGIDSYPMTTAEWKSLWEGMYQDRNLTASVLATMITKALILNYYEMKPELTESLLNLLTSKPLVQESEKSRTSSSVKNDMKRYVELRSAVLNSIYYVVLHYPFDCNHFSLKKSATYWAEDLEKTKAARDFAFESEVCALLTLGEKLDGEAHVKDALSKCANLTTAKADLIEFYNNGTFPQGKSLGETLLFSFLLGSIQRGVNRSLIGSTATQLLSHWTAMNDHKFYALVIMIKEFLFKDPSVDSKSLQAINDALNTFCVWPSPFCDTALDLMRYLEFRRRMPGVPALLDFIQAHPELISKNKQEYIHVIVNEESLYGSAFKDALSFQQTSTPHELKSKFLLFFYRSFIEEDTEIYQFSAMDQIIVNQLFTKAIDIVFRVANQNGNISKNNLNPKIKDFKQSIEENLASLGTTVPKVPASSIGELDVGCLPFILSEFQEKEFVFLDKGITTSNGDEFPEVGGYVTLEKIFSQYSNRTSSVNLKIAICGGDATVSNIAWGYVLLKNLKPELLKFLNVSFYIIPAGSENKIAGSLSLIDPWYGRQVLLAMRSVMQVIPNTARLPFQDKRGRSETMAPLGQRDLFEKKDLGNASGIPPALFIRNNLDHYLRQANQSIPFRVYVAEISVFSNGPIIKRTIPFCQSFEVGFTAFGAAGLKAENLLKSGKRSSSNIAKPQRFIPPEVTVKFTEIDVAGVSHASPLIPSKAYWSIQVSNLPRTSEYEAVKPFANCLELHLLDLENGRKARGKPSPLDDGPIHYINFLEVEDTSKRLFDVVIDNQPISSVFKLKIFPAPDPSQTSAEGVASQGSIFPVMTFFPIL